MTHPWALLSIHHSPTLGRSVFIQLFDYLSQSSYSWMSLLAYLFNFTWIGHCSPRPRFPGKIQFHFLAETALPHYMHVALICCAVLTTKLKLTTRRAWCLKLMSPCWWPSFVTDTTLHGYAILTLSKEFKLPSITMLTWYKFSVFVQVSKANFLARPTH